MLTVRTSENTVITSFRLISERQDFSSVRTGENTVRARARIHRSKEELVNHINRWIMQVNAEPVIYRWKWKLEDIESAFT